MRNKKIFILDTSVLICNPFAYTDFSGEIILPITVLEELDKLKKYGDMVGRNARVAIRNLDSITNEKQSEIKFDAGNYSAIGSDGLYGDNKILACAVAIKDKNPKSSVILVSRDYALRVRAKILGIGAENYDKNPDITELYKGYSSVRDDETGLQLLNRGYVYDYDLSKFHQNECITFEDADGNKISAGRVIDDKIKLIKDAYPWGLKPRNREQAFAAELILDTNIPLVSLIGLAGSGKTICALACALELVIEKRKYDSLIIYRPIQDLGNQSLGYTPGPQPLSAKILTPTGWTTMGKLSTGDEVISRDGKSTKILQIFPKGKKSVYKISTNEKNSTEACEDHLWKVKIDKEWCIKNTKEIDELLKIGKKCFLPRNEIAKFEEQSLPIPPYTLGALLGDGCLSDTKIKLYNTDQDLISKINSELNTMNYCLNKTGKIGYNIVPSSPLRNKYRIGKLVKATNLITKEEIVFKSIADAARFYNIHGSSMKKRCNKKYIIDNTEFTTIHDGIYYNAVKKSIHDLGLYEKIHDTKFIPDIYKFNSVENRIELLRGLMDTDGTIKKNGESSFCTTSRQLADDVIDLVKSLGGRAVIRERDRRGNANIINNNQVICRKISYEFNISLPKEINPFFIKRKADRFKGMQISNQYISKIEYMIEDDVQCILVENQEHLYITNDYIVTHNTIEEKLAPWFVPIDDAFSVLFSDKNDKTRKKDNWKLQLHQYVDSGMIQKEALTYIRGRSIQNSLIILDEAQNLSKEEMKAILTRAGNNSKILLTGDISQIDNPKLDAINNGLTYAIEKFKDSNLAAHITFEKGERSPLATAAAEIL